MYLSLFILNLWKLAYVIKRSAIILSRWKDILVLEDTAASESETTTHANTGVVALYYASGSIDMLEFDVRHVEIHIFVPRGDCQ